MKFEELSFAGMDTTGAFPKVKPWDPVRSGDYATDCAAGRAYFNELHNLIRDSGNPTFLSRVLSAQVQGGTWEAVEIGFSQAMSESLLRA
jgi:hypothetical protein